MTILLDHEELVWIEQPILGAILFVYKIEEGFLLGQENVELLIVEVEAKDRHQVTL